MIMLAFQRSFLAATLLLLSQGSFKVKLSTSLLLSHLPSPSFFLSILYIYLCCWVIMISAALLQGSDMCCSVVRLAAARSFAEGAHVFEEKAISLHRVWCLTLLMR